LDDVLTQKNLEVSSAPLWTDNANVEVSGAIWRCIHGGEQWGETLSVVKGGAVKHGETCKFLIVPSSEAKMRRQKALTPHRWGVTSQQVGAFERRDGFLLDGK
jgi:hypothetical protein